MWMHAHKYAWMHTYVEANRRQARQDRQTLRQTVHSVSYICFGLRSCAVVVRLLIMALNMHVHVRAAHANSSWPLLRSSTLPLAMPSQTCLPWRYLLTPYSLSSTHPRAQKASRWYAHVWKLLRPSCIYRYVQTQCLRVCFRCMDICICIPCIHSIYISCIYTLLLKSRMHATAFCDTTMRILEISSWLDLYKIFDYIRWRVVLNACDMLLAHQAVLALRGWTLEQWAGIYTDLPSRMTKVLVKDRAAVKVCLLTYALVRIHTYMHACIHTYLHIYIHTYWQIKRSQLSRYAADIHMHTHTYIHGRYSSKMAQQEMPAYIHVLSYAYILIQTYTAS
jgi:hypothetical protein